MNNACSDGRVGLTICQVALADPLCEMWSYPSRTSFVTSANISPNLKTDERFLEIPVLLSVRPLVRAAKQFCVREYLFLRRRHSALQEQRVAEITQKFDHTTGCHPHSSWTISLAEVKFVVLLVLTSSLPATPGGENPRDRTHLCRPCRRLPRR